VSSPDRTATLLESALPRAAITRRPADDLLGEIPVAAPDSAEQWSEVLRLAGRERLCVLPLGLGSKLGWLRTPERLDLALSSARFHGVSAFEAADGTITARAGTTLAALSEAVSATHHLSPEIALPRASTLGGVLAAGTSGLDRLRHGPVRHQVLGITVALADGSLVKSGGRVVKNVTGYDLHRLWCGSSGTLCVLLETTLRLYPRPAREAVLEARFADRAGALERARALVRSAVQPVAVVVEEQGSEWCLSVVLSGRDEIVAHDVDEMRRGLPGSVLHEGADAQRARAELRDRERPDGTWSPLALACRPSRLARELERLDTALAGRGLRATQRIQPLLAHVDVRIEGPRERWLELDRELDGDAQRRWRSAPAELMRASGPDGRSAPELALQQRLKTALDPQGLFADGRPHGGAR